MPDADLEEVIALERRTLDPALRRDPAAVAGLLHPDFSEVGASGRVWDRDSVVAALAAETGEPPRALDFSAVRLAADVVLLTYRTVEPASLRTSIWCRYRGGPWRLRHHQGTPSA